MIKITEDGQIENIDYRNIEFKTIKQWKKKSI